MPPASSLLSTPSLPRVQIRSSRDSADCDCCGWYDYGTARIELPDGRVLEADHDGHFGSGCWDGNDELLYYWALQALGFALRVNGEPLQERLYLERDGCGDWQEVPLFEGTPVPVELTLVTIPDPRDPQYTTPASVSWKAPDGTTRSV